MENKRSVLVIFSVFFVCLSVLTYFVFRPFLNTMILAMVLTVLFYPLYEKLLKFFRGNKNFTAGLLVIIALIFLILPILFLGLQISGQAQNFFSLNQVDRSQYLDAIQLNINTFVQHIVPSFYFNISDAINRLLSFISSNFSDLLSQTTYIFFQTFILLITLFFFLRDGEKILDSFVSLSPFEKDQNKQLVSSVNRTITSVVRGTLFVGLIRFMFIVAAFHILGIPDAILWGSVGGIVGAVPGIGTPFVIIPACIYLLFYGNIFLVISMAVFGILISFFIDNLLSVYLFGKGLDVPSVFVLFSILGGIVSFGPLGFIFGPMILSLFISLVEMYKILVLNKPHHQS